MKLILLILNLLFFNIISGQFAYSTVNLEKKIQQRLIENHALLEKCKKNIDTFHRVAQSLRWVIQQPQTTPKQTSEAYWMLANIYDGMGSYQTALYCITLSLRAGNNSNLKILIWASQYTHLPLATRIHCLNHILKFQYSKDCLENEINLTEAQASAHLLLGDLCDAQETISHEGLNQVCKTTQQTALDHYEKALIILRKEIFLSKNIQESVNFNRIGNVKLQAQALMKIGNHHKNQEKGIFAFQEALKISLEIGDLNLQREALLGIGCSSTEATIDALHQVIQKADELKNFSLKAQALFELGHQVMDSQMEYYQEAITLANEIGDQKLSKNIRQTMTLKTIELESDETKISQAEFFVELANTLEPELSLSYYRHALELVQSIQDVQRQFKTLELLGSFIKQNRINFYTEAIILAEDSRDDILKTNALLMLGKQKINSQTNNTRALNLANRLQNLYLQGYAYLGLGNAMINQKENYTKAFEISRKIQNRLLEAKSLIGLGNCHLDSEVNFQKALTLGQTLQKTTIQIQALIGLGNVFASSQKNHEAIEYFNKALQLTKHNSMYYQIIQKKIELAKRYLVLKYYIPNIVKKIQSDFQSETQ